MVNVLICCNMPFSFSHFTSKLHGQLEMHRYSKGRWQSSKWVIWSAWCSECRPGLFFCTECFKRGHWTIDAFLQDHPEEIWSWALLWYVISHWDKLIVLAGHATRLTLNMGPLFSTALKAMISKFTFLSICSIMFCSDLNEFCEKKSWLSELLYCHLWMDANALITKETVLPYRTLHFISILFCHIVDMKKYAGIITLPTFCLIVFTILCYRTRIIKVIAVGIYEACINLWACFIRILHVYKYLYW